MFFRILKKDLKRKKGINLILFLFIVIATIFLAGSVNNMLVVSNATTYFMDKAKIPEYIISMQYKEENSPLKEWLEQEKESGEVKDFERTELLTLAKSNINIDTDCTIYLGRDENDYVKAFDENGDEIHLEKGETTLPIATAEENNIKIGDFILIQTKNGEERFLVAALTKDAVYAGDMAGMIRLSFCESDYEYLKDNTEAVWADLFEVETENVKDFEEHFNKQMFDGNPIMLSKETIKLLYVMDLVVAGMLAAIGICLIGIAILVLRFTIGFTIQEDYREIGIMKAIGIQNSGIKGIYLVKYLAIVTVGSVIGCILSFPFGNIMMKSASKRMIMENSSQNGIYNVICAVFVILFVVGLCYLSMRKLNKLSAIDAIRSGSNGERFKKKSAMRIEKTHHMNAPFFMACNDILSDFKSYVVLLLVFAIGIVLLTVPFNTLNTMRSSEMSSQFLMDKDAVCFVKSMEDAHGKDFENVQEYHDAMIKLQNRISDAGYEATVSGAVIYGVVYQSDECKEGKNILSVQPVDSKGDYYTYTNGTRPVLENEIAISEKSMKKLGVHIGDEVTAKMPEGEKRFIITGSYQDYMQLGESVRLSSAVDMTGATIYTTWCSQIYIKGITEKEQEDVINKLNKEISEYKFSTAQEIIDTNVGGIVTVMEKMRIWLVLLIAGINILITSLMMKMFILKEKGQIAMLRSIGFRNWSIRSWQAIRIGLILIIASVVAIPLSKCMDYFALRPIFGIMGAAIKIQVRPMEVYLLYPMILLLLVFPAALFIAGSVKKIDIREMNNLE